MERVNRQTFSVTNSGSTAKTYTLTNVPAGTASTVEAVSNCTALTL